MTAVMPLGTFNQVDLTEAWPLARETHGSPN
jgi:hypothetical protein